MGQSSAHMKKAKLRSSIIEWLALFAVAVQAPLAFSQAVELAAGQAVLTQVNAGEISLKLVVHDKKNRPVLDLKPGEIEVTDSGSPATLNGLRLVTGKQEFEHLVTLVFDRPVPIAGTANLTDPSTIQTERATVTKILKLFPQDGFSFCVLNVEGRLRLQHGFTSDRRALEEAVKAATEPIRPVDSSPVNQAEQQLLTVALTGADVSGKPVSARDRVLAQALFSALNNSGHIAQDQHLRPSLAGLLALAQSQHTISQKKDVIYFTSMQDRQVDSRARDAIKSIIGTANLAGMSIYVVDMNSLDRMGSQMSAQDAFGLQPAAIQARGLAPVEKDTDHNDMQNLAEETGGSYITGDRLRKSVDEMIEDTTTYYVASYPSPNNELDGEFHSVVVKPLRAGIRIRSQAGYLALPPHAGAGYSPQTFELSLLKILSGTQLPTDVAFRAAILQRGGLADGNIDTLAVEVPLSSLDLREDSNSGIYLAHISIVADVKDKSGTIVEHFSAEIPRRGLLKDAEMARFEAITLQRHFLASPGQYILEAAILDCNSGKAGAQRISFELPAAAAIPSLGNMALVRRLEPFGPGDDPSDSLRHGNDKVTPNLSGQLPPGAKEVSVFFVAHTSLHAEDAATLKALVFRDGKLLGGAPPITQQAGASEFSSYLTSFSIDPPMDGLYEVRINLSQGGKTAEASVSFTMAGARSAKADPPDPEVDAAALETSPRPVGPLVIALPPNPMKRPAPDELRSILADARRNAMDYRASLPNFMCQRVTDRSIDQDGNGKWKHKDKFTELLTYFDHEESRTMLEIEQDGERIHEDTGDSEGVQSAGEFGAVVTGLFRPASKAEFQWKETGVLADGTVQVFDYRVAREDSTLNLRISPNEVVTVGFHGQVFIDSATRCVRRISQVVDKVPKGFPIHATSVSVDYDYVAINNHDYLLPVGAQIIVRKGRRETDMNEIEFRNFRRFGSTLRILDDVREVKP